MTTISILGATGSIGRSTRAVIEANPGKFRVEAVVGGHHAAALAAVARQLGAKHAALFEAAALPALRDALHGTGITSAAGNEAVREAAARPSDIIVAGIAGVAGLEPTFASLAPGRRIALANKETLVCAGNCFMERAREVGALILPMDSEHNAVSQALGARPLQDVTRITLTASGGPFREWPAERIAAATCAEALAHPNYAMGSKVTVDSAGLMNKGLELIEAHHIFGIEAARLDAVVHPQQIIHGLVSFRDGSVIAGMAKPDMRVPIADCLMNGRRLDSGVTPVDLATVGQLTFERPDFARFPALRLAVEALAAGGAAPAVLNAANEEAVAAFLSGVLTFGQIAPVIADTLSASPLAAETDPGSVFEALEIDRATRLRARAIIARRSAA
jgi:1-deoxy-D-xylulose-5-phosphate reductoisomerase